MDAREVSEGEGVPGGSRAVRELFDSAPIALMRLVGPDHRFVAANAAYRRLVGGRRILGLTAREALPELLGQQIFDVADHVYGSGEPFTFREWRVQLDTPDAGGRKNIYVDGSITPRFDDQGQVYGLDFHIQDVTARAMERQSAQRRAAEAEHRHENAGDLVVELQRELLPAGLPVLPGLRIAASYLPAGAGGASAVGGDWFDAVPLPGGRVALVVGDVVGRGVTASATMGRLRAVLQDRLEEDGDIGRALAAVDRMARGLPAARAATVCVTVVDPADGSLTYCTAGHPPPLLVTAGGVSRYLAATGAGPLGTGSAFPLGRDRLEDGALVLLYSDGIIERPGRQVSTTTVELAQVTVDAAADRALRGSGLPAVERVTTQPLELLIRATGHTDDITLLAAQRCAPPAALRVDAPASLMTIPITRIDLESWLADVGAGQRDVQALQYAVGELMTNAAEHAYAGGDAGAVRLRATLTEYGQAVVEVADDGVWQDHAPGSDELGLGRGRGLATAADFVDDLHLDRGEKGTVVTIRHRLSRPARLLTAGEMASVPPPPSRGAPESLLVLDEPYAKERRIRLEGPIDAITARQLHDELQIQTGGGTRSLTVDLTGVTHLSSAGVAVLHQALARAERHATPLHLHAAPATPAQHVLTVAALPHTTTAPGEL